MTHKKEDNPEVIVDLEEVYGKSEKFVVDNKNRISLVVLAIVLLGGGFFVYQNLIVAPLEKEAQEEIWRAELLFEKDSFASALNGGAQFAGFIDIIDDYGSTKTGNLAHYYAGICSYQLGNHEDAISYLEDYSGNDPMLSPIALGCIGDSYVAMDDLETAKKYYVKAANKVDNAFTAPVFLMKAAQVCEELQDFDAALKIYQDLEKKYPKSNEGQNIEKYISRTQARL